jgi:hypothetical protein
MQMRNMILVAAIAVHIPAYAESAPKCDEFPQKCNDIEMLIAVNNRLTKACDALSDKDKYMSDLCQLGYLTDEMLLGRGYLKGANGWHKATEKEIKKWHNAPPAE